MLSNLKRFASAPTFADAEKTRRAGLLHTMLLVCLTGATAFLVIVGLSAAPFGAKDVTLTALVLPVAAAGLWLLRLGYVRAISIVLVIGLWLIFTLASLPDAGLQDPAYPGFLILILIGTFLLGTRTGIILAVLSAAVGLVMLYMNDHELITPSPVDVNLAAYWGAQSLYFIVGALIIHLATRNLHHALDRAHRGEANLRRVNRAYRVLSDSNQAMIRAADEMTLLADVCQVIVDVGGYRFVWVGFAGGDSTQPIRPVASAGDDAGYLDTLSDASLDRDPTRVTVRTGATQVQRDLRKTMRTTAALYRFDTVIALPLIIDGGVLGSLNVYSDFDDAFDSEEIDLLEELAADLSFGIRSLRTRDDHQRMTDALSTQHMLLRTVIDEIPDTIFMKDWEGRYTLVNRAYAEFEGTTPEAIIGKTTFDLFPDELAKFFHDEDLRHMRSGSPIINYLQEGFRKGTGEKHWFLMNQVFVRDARGDVSGLIGIGHDITDRIRLEEELSYQANLLENVSDAIISTTPDLMIVSWNKAAEQMYGVSAREAIGRPLFDRVATAYGQTSAEVAIQEIMEAGFWQAEVTQTTRDGRQLTVLVAASLLRDSQGEVNGIVIVNRDITEHKKAEAAARLAEIQRERFFTIAADFLSITEVGGIFKRVNPAVERLLGYKPEELEGTHYLELVHPEDRESTRAQVVTLHEDHPVENFPNRIRHRDGSYRWILWSVVPHLEEAVIYSAGRDVTEQRRVQEALLEQQQIQMQYQKEKELNETRTQLTSMVSHEFRVPLGVIQSSADLLERYWERMLSDKRGEHLRRIRSQVKHLDALVSDFALVLHAESGHLVFTPSLMNLELFCRDLVEEFEVTLGNEHELVFLFEGVSSDIQADAALLGHILRNLLSNAIKYSPKGGEIRLELSQTQNDVIIIIQDQGIGIPPDDLPHLFSPYRRASNVGNVRGTGMGLKIVKDCVELHGGRIDVTSELNQGTTFTVTLPATGAINL